MAGEVQLDSFEAIGFRPPTLNETDVLRQIWLSDNSSVRHEVFEHFAEQMRVQNPRIEDVIDHDQILFLRELDFMANGQEAKEYMQSLEVGYGFVLGSLAGIDYYRSRYRTPRVYEQLLPFRSVMPVKTADELERVQHVRSGEASASLGTPLLALGDYRRFLDAAPQFSGLVQETLERLDDGLILFDRYDLRINPMGMMEGVTHAVSMCIQSREQRTLSALERRAV